MTSRNRSPAPTRAICAPLMNSAAASRSRAHSREQKVRTDEQGHERQAGIGEQQSIDELSRFERVLLDVDQQHREEVRGEPH